MVSTIHQIQISHNYIYVCVCVCVCMYVYRLPSSSAVKNLPEMQEIQEMVV